MKSKFLLLLACLVMASVSLPAQNVGSTIGNKFLNKLKSKGNQKADQAINSAVDKPVDATEQKVKESVKGSSSKDASATSTEGAAMTQPASGNTTTTATQTSTSHQGDPPTDDQMKKYMEMMGGGAVSIEDYPDLAEIKPSPWTGSFDMVTNGFDKNGKPLKDQEAQIFWFVNKYDVAMIPDIKVNGKQQDSRMIIKRKQGIMLILTNDNGSKTGMIMKLKTMSVDLSQTDFDDDMKDVQVEVLKNVTKTVNNQHCYKVRAWNDQFESISWVSERVGINFQDLMGFMSVQSQGKSKYEEAFGHIKGMPIQTTSTDKKTGEVTTMDIMNLKPGDPNSAMFNHDDYNLIALPDIGAFGGGYGQ